MFVGHYAVALAAKRFSPGVSLGWTFLAVQLLDILWGLAIVLGIEHTRVLPGYWPGSSLVFYDIPWTHGLLITVGWSWLMFRLSKQPVLGICVFSHWVLDWLVHVHDLPLFRGGPLVGLGLWRYRHATFVTETALLLIGLLIYLQATRAKGKGGKDKLGDDKLGELGMPALVVLLVVLEAIVLYAPTPRNIIAIAIGLAAALVVIALVAGWLDRFREPLPPEAPVRLELT